MYNNSIGCFNIPMNIEEKIRTSGKHVMLTTSDDNSK